MKKAEDLFKLYVTNAEVWKGVSNECHIANSWAPFLEGVRYKVPRTALHNKVVIPVRHTDDI